MIEVHVTEAAFDVAAVVAALSSEGVGAVASFVGVVRGSGGLVSLTLEHYPAMTHGALRSLAEAVAVRWSLSGVVVHHRVGTLAVGAPIVLVACAAPHRRDALDACAHLIDRLKTDAPFWKSERFDDGRVVWIEPHGG